MYVHAEFRVKRSSVINTEVFPLSRVHLKQRYKKKYMRLKLFPCFAFVFFHRTANMAVGDANFRSHQNLRVTEFTKGVTLCH